MLPLIPRILSLPKLERPDWSVPISPRLAEAAADYVDEEEIDPDEYFVKACNNGTILLSFFEGDTEYEYHFLTPTHVEVSAYTYDEQ